MKKLIPALCMLLIAAALMGTSTYAWFSMNTKVTATGMQVKAATNANLYIASGANVSAASIKEITVNINDEQATSLMPSHAKFAASTLTMQTPNGWTSEPTPSNKGTPSGYQDDGTVSNVGDIGTNAGKYAYVKPFTLVRKSASESAASDITAAVTFNFGDSLEVNGALRCGFIVDDQFYQCNDNQATFTGTYECVFSDAKVIKNLADNTAKTVTFVLWYEGDDDQCVSDKAIGAIANTQVSISFTASDYVAG